MPTNLLPDAQQQAADFDRPLHVPIKRRSFFMYAGATAGATALVLAGCSKDDTTTASTVTLGTGDTGVLNYAYALEQLEAAFYTQVRQGSYYNALAAGSAERQILDDLYYHEVIHRELFKTALGTNAIKALEPNFSGINFGDKGSVLSTARTFEDLGVAAYNGAGQYISSPAYLFLAGKIVSVEARHAALISDLITEGSFVRDAVVTVSTASTYPSTGNTNYAPAASSLERSMTPNDVVNAANNFLANGSKLAAPNTF